MDPGCVIVYTLMLYWHTQAGEEMRVNWFPYTVSLMISEWMRATPLTA